MIHAHARPHARGHHHGDLAPIEGISSRNEPDWVGAWNESELIEDIREMARRYPFTTSYMKSDPFRTRIGLEVPALVDHECVHGRLPSDPGPPCLCHSNRTNGRTLY